MRRPCDLWGCGRDANEECVMVTLRGKPKHLKLCEYHQSMIESAIESRAMSDEAD